MPFFLTCLLVHLLLINPCVCLCQHLPWISVAPKHISACSHLLFISPNCPSTCLHLCPACFVSYLHCLPAYVVPLASLIILLASSPLFLLFLPTLSSASVVALLPLFSNFLALLTYLLHLLSCFCFLPHLQHFFFSPACFSLPYLNNLFIPSFVSIALMFAYVLSCFHFSLICLAISLMLVHLYKTLLL